MEIGLRLHHILGLTSRRALFISPCDFLINHLIPRGFNVTRKLPQWRVGRVRSVLFRLHECCAREQLLPSAYGISQCEYCLVIPLSPPFTYLRDQHPDHARFHPEVSLVLTMARCLQTFNAVIMKRSTVSCVSEIRTQNLEYEDLYARCCAERCSPWVMFKGHVIHTAVSSSTLESSVLNFPLQWSNLGMDPPEYFRGNQILKVWDPP